MLIAMLHALFGGCRHRNYTFPQSPRRGIRTAAASVTGTYVVCLHCGQELPYDWDEMKVVTPASATPGSVTHTVGAVKAYAGK